MACKLGGKHVCGYCKLHHVTVTLKQMKNRKCREKECYHFVKNSKHPYWIEKERIKAEKKAKRAQLRGEDTSNGEQNVCLLGDTGRTDGQGATEICEDAEWTNEDVHPSADGEL